MINDYELAKRIRPYDERASGLIEDIPTVSHYVEHGKLPFNGSVSAVTRQRIIGEIEESLEYQVEAEEVDSPTGSQIVFKRKELAIAS